MEGLSAKTLRWRGDCMPVMCRGWDHDLLRQAGHVHASRLKALCDAESASTSQLLAVFGVLFRPKVQKKFWLSTLCATLGRVLRRQFATEGPRGSGKEKCVAAAPSQ